MEVDGKVKVLERIHEHCEPCEEDGITVESAGLCRECEQYMCRACFKHHLKGKFCKHHVFVDVAKSEVKLTKSVEVCAVHNETVKFYCKQHSEVGCGECMVMKHNGCNMEYIKDLAINVKKGEQLKLVLKQIDDIELSAVENSTKIRKVEKKYKESLDGARTEILKFRKSIEDKVAKVGAKLLEDLKQKGKETDALFSVLSANNEDIRTEIAEIKGMLNPETYTDSGLYINIINAKPRILTIASRGLEVKTKADVENVYFKPDRDFKRILDNIETIGTLDLGTEQTFGYKHQVVSCEETTEQGSISRTTIPGPLVFEELDKSKRRFLQSSNKYKAILEQRMKSNNARVIWDEKSFLRVEHTAELTDFTGGDKLRDSTTKCQQILRDISDNLMLQRIEKICPARWYKLQLRLKKIVVPDPDTVSVIRYDKEHAVVVVGEDEPVLSLFTQIVNYVAEIVGQDKSYRT